MTQLEDKAKNFIMALYPSGTEVTKSFDGLDFIEHGHSPDIKRLSEAQMYFIEELTFASEPELRNFVGMLWEDPISMLPVWARNLAYRLLCLQCPNDPDVLESAAADLFAHGPDWDAEAERLKAKAKRLRSTSP
jgi:hypothetical protein